MIELLLGMHSTPDALTNFHHAQGTIQLVRSGEQATVSMQVPVPPRKAWKVLTNYTQTLGAMPDVVSVQLVSRQNQTVRLRQVLQAPYTFGLRVQALLEGKEDPQRLRLSYNLVNGERIRALSGRWSLTPEAGGTRVVHSIRLTPEVPTFLQGSFRNLHDSSLRQSFKTLRQLMLDSSALSKRLSRPRASITTSPKPLNNSASDWPDTAAFSNSSWGLTRRSANSDTLRNASKRLLHSQP